MQKNASYTDDLLLSQLKKGSETAFTEIYNRYWQKLYAIAYNRTNSKAAAEDVVHEVLTSLWHRRFESDIQSLYGYLSAATKYSVMRQMLRLRNQNIIRLNPDDTDLAVDDNSIDYQFLRQMISSEINRLPEKCKLVFQYSRQAGLTNKEIAVQLQISEKAVEKHITKAIRTLRVQLKHFFSFFIVIW